MSDDVTRHYDTLLAEHYTWMAGGLAARLAQSEQTFQKLGIKPGGRGALAIDLGAGSGFQAIPLARLGFEVVAIDTSARLLGEIDEVARGLKIRTLRGDLRGFAATVPGTPELIVCMGDTLTHLPEERDVAELFKAARGKLAPGGRLILTYRDLAKPPAGLDRFIPVRSEPDRTFTCFLEDQGDKVLVHDLLHVRDETGAWTLRKSAYPKLKLAADRVVALLEEAGLAVRVREAANGMITLVAAREK